MNIRAISVADTSDSSTVRFVFDDPEKAKNILIATGYTPKETEVLAVEIPDHPGQRDARVLKPLKAAGINVHYLYPHLGRMTAMPSSSWAWTRPRRRRRSWPPTG